MTLSVGDGLGTEAALPMTANRSLFVPELARNAFNFNGER